MTSLGLEFILAKLDPESILHYRANFPDKLKYFTKKNTKITEWPLNTNIDVDSGIIQSLNNLNINESTQNIFNFFSGFLFKLNDFIRNFISNANRAVFLKKYFNIKYKLEESTDHIDYVNVINTFKDNEFPCNLPKNSPLNVKWLRIKDDNRFSYCIYNYPKMIDFKQGRLGDCWLIAAMAVLIEKPFILKDIFLNKKSGLSLTDEYVGRYHVKLWYKSKNFNILKYF